MKVVGEIKAASLLTLRWGDILQVSLLQSEVQYRLIMDPVHASFSIHIQCISTASENIGMLECEKIRGFPVDFPPEAGPYNEVPQTGGKDAHKQRHLFLTVLEADVQDESMSFQRASPVSSHDRERVRELFCLFLEGH